MKNQLKFLQWTMALLFIAGSMGVMGQPYPTPGDHTVCIGSIEPYGVIQTVGSDYLWEILPGTGGNGTITPGATPNLITVEWTSAGTCTLQVTETSEFGCIGDPVQITVTVTPENTISLTSTEGTDNQTICINTPITDITYATTGATGATVSGLPAGVTGSWAADVVTISGTPTVAGTFVYTVTLTGGCGTVTATGTINVTLANTITLTSDPETDNQSVCINTPITNITYATKGATGATISGLPAGVTGSWSSNVVTITGTPTESGIFNYTIELTGGCGTVTANGTITVNPKPVTSPIYHN